MTGASIKTRVLILSDTHGVPLQPPSINPDVVIHCGDLTDGSLLAEFNTTIASLTSINASLKIAIPGNHDFTLDAAAFTQKVTEANPPLDEADVIRFYGSPGEARQRILDAGIILLDEGIHTFHLPNGAKLTLYASPFTPSIGCGWGFQYHPDTKHDFALSSTSLDTNTSSNIDIALTHGPPRGILDRTSNRENAGCPQLFAAVAAARPKLHCFGHIHEGWGARKVRWRDPETYMNRQPSHLNSIDNEKSCTVLKVADLKPGKFDDEEEVGRKSARREELERQGYVKVDAEIEEGRETLFVNASAVDEDGKIVHVPWVVDLDLEKCQ
jgi:hypothetical protein